MMQAEVLNICVVCLGISHSLLEIGMPQGDAGAQRRETGGAA